MLEKVFVPDPSVKYSVWIAGKMRCPPEDSGGIHGYAEILKILKDETHEEYETYSDWVGDKFDPQRFGLVLVNKKFKQKQFGCNGT